MTSISVSLKELTQKEMDENGERWDDIVHAIIYDFDDKKLPQEQFEERFINGFFYGCGFSFRIWTENNVYFPIIIGGLLRIGSLRRNPCDDALKLFGEF